MIKNGTRLKSQVCETQVIIVRSSEALDDLRAGGSPMIPVGDEIDTSLALDDGLAGARRWANDMSTARGRGAGDQRRRGLTVDRIDASGDQGSQTIARQRLDGSWLLSLPPKQTVRSDAT